MYQIIKYCRDCGAYSGREFGRKADAVRYAPGCTEYKRGKLCAIYGG